MVRGLQQKRLQSYDGTELCYYIGGSGPAVVLANGLGGPLPAYQYIIEQLISEYTVLSWDYRGMFGSGQPAVSSHLSVHHQVGDMWALMESCSIGQAVIVGWSMGVYCEILKQLGEHDGYDNLSSVHVPDFLRGVEGFEPASCRSSMS